MTAWLIALLSAALTVWIIGAVALWRENELCMPMEVREKLVIIFWPPVLLWGTIAELVDRLRSKGGGK